MHTEECVGGWCKCMCRVQVALGCDCGVQGFCLHPFLALYCAYTSVDQAAAVAGNVAHCPWPGYVPATSQMPAIHTSY